MTEEIYIKWGGIGINKIGSLVYRSEEFVRKVFYKIFRESVIKSSFGSCGKNVHIAEKSDIKGIGNISIGDDVAIGPHALLWTTRANIIIKEKVIIGPRLSIITGNHKINAVGKYMADVTDEEKDEENDQDSLGSGNLSSIQPTLRHLIDFITVQHQVGCESVMLVKKNVPIFNGQKLV